MNDFIEMVILFVGVVLVGVDVVVVWVIDVLLVVQ